MKTFIALFVIILFLILLVYSTYHIVRAIEERDCLSIFGFGLCMICLYILGVFIVLVELEWYSVFGELFI